MSDTSNRWSRNGRQMFLQSLDGRNGRDPRYQGACVTFKTGNR